MAAVLVLVAIVGLLGAAAVQETLFGQTLSATRLFHQRAQGLSDLGIAHALMRLGQTPLPADFTEELHPVPAATDSVVVTLRHIGTSAMPAGYSAGRFVAHRFQIQSTGQSARQARAVQIQGVTQVLPQMPAAAAAPP